MTLRSFNDISFCSYLVFARIASVQRDVDVYFEMNQLQAVLMFCRTWKVPAHLFRGHVRA